ncbi:hypothetical protein [Dyadobacter arcticus]|uniref:Uncharacterized protein n=1 Tax=Dyadobacter arcticus TaxID=1078754 RepID=A0ABX0UR15_9BACT|nr:hypothetical protein [Dyadobacter arcticus]NIJ55427.1 hypothetical protein [Dyadobacter arcticus]
MDLEKWIEKLDILQKYRYEYVREKNHLAAGKKKNAKGHKETMKRYQILTESLTKGSSELRDFFSGNFDDVGKLESLMILKRTRILSMILINFLMPLTRE